MLVFDGIGTLVSVTHPSVNAAAGISVTFSPGRRVLASVVRRIGRFRPADAEIDTLAEIGDRETRARRYIGEHHAKWESMQKSLGSVDMVYRQVRTMAANFDFKPDQRINEGSLAKELGTSRTPLREALNRLVAEGFLNFNMGRGFFCRSLEPSNILDLYEARQAIECEALRLAVTRAKDVEIQAIKTFLKETDAAYSSASSSRTLVEIDEEFHVRMVRLSANHELERILTNLNARIRYVRWIDMNDRRSITPAAHLRIVEALERRDESMTVAEMRRHIGRRSEEATAAVRTAFSQLYVPQQANR